MKTFLIMALLFPLMLAYPQKVKTGIEVLAENNFVQIKNKRVGLITNPTGVDSKLKSTIDILFNAPDVKLVALYGPEHGVRGDYSAGDKVENYIDDVTKLPVYSLYGATRKPTKKMLDGIDILIFDIQDIGCRSYTYISTMGLAMEACAENGIEFMVLDRPNPLGGYKIEGNLVEEGFFSFVSQFKIPYIHALTVGELAKMLNEEKMLAKGVQCKLTIIQMEGWKRFMRFKDTYLPWVLTSPHIPYQESSEFYVTSGILGELGVISEGVGYTLPFQLLGAEWINSVEMANALNAKKLPGVIFRPLTFKPYYGKSSGKTLHGVQIYITDYDVVNLMNIQFLFMDVHSKLYPDKNPFVLADKSRLGMFDKVCGTDKIRELFTKNMNFDDIKDYLYKDVEEFRKVSSKYYLYN
ncbi:MAG: DUF1343 domain-containing protein [Ignavibacteriaceae bacterium]|nr:DUF1343 domain-containing protein [Ignavibacteriaceae bacterium]